jgi:hypothetical protein
MRYDGSTAATDCPHQRTCGVEPMADGHGIECGRSGQAEPNSVCCSPVAVAGERRHGPANCRKCAWEDNGFLALAGTTTVDEQMTVAPKERLLWEVKDAQINAEPRQMR